MNKLIPALALVVLLLAAGCDKNDENTINSLPKTHNVYPVFTLKVENSFTGFGIDSVLLTVDPDIGWLAEVRSDKNGFVGTMASGTFIIEIDTSVTTDPDTQLSDTVVDTTSIIFGFEPSGTYTFTFTREEEFIWADTFRAIYAMTIDSVWLVDDADTLEVSTDVDSDISFDTVLDLLMLIDDPSDTAGNPPDSIHEVQVPIGFWFDTGFVLTNPAIEESFPPDSFDTTLESWGFWYRVDSFFMSTDSANWCDIAIDTIVENDETTYVEMIEIKVDTLKPDVNGYLTWTIDTVYHYADCPEYPGIREVIYKNWGWGNYDTTIHAVYPDTNKSLIFEQDGIKVINHVTNDTNQAMIYLDDASGMRTVNNLQLELVLPSEEVYPHYEIIIRDEGKK